MICIPCKDAGKHLTAGDVDMARKHHALCQKVQDTAGKTWCDCHHSLVSSLNTLLIKPKNEVVE